VLCSLPLCMPVYMTVRPILLLLVVVVAESLHAGLYAEELLLYS